MRRRILLALGLSLGLHALLFAVLLRLDQKTARPGERQRPLVVEVVQRPAAPTGPRPTDRRPAPGHPGGSSRTTAPSPAAPSAPASRSDRPDAPSPVPNLFPQGAFAIAIPDAPEPEAPDAGPPAAILARRIQTWRLGSLAEQRVATGVDSYFSTLAHALRDRLGTPPPKGSPRLGTPSAGQRWLEGWLQSLDQADTPPPEPPRMGERGPTQPEHDLGGRESDLVHRLLGPMAPTMGSLSGPFELFKKTQLPPAAVLHVEQDAEGHLTRVDLVASSGDATFDAWVKRAAALALAAMPRPPDHGAGLHPDGTRSEWAFFRSGDGVSVLLLRVY